MKRLLLLILLTIAVIVVPGCSETTTPGFAYRGINLSGAESGSKYPGTEGVDFIWPSTTQIDYFYGKGMNTFRVNFMWERLQPTAKGSLDATQLGKLKTVVNYATNKGAVVLLNPQNFARYYGQVVGTTAVPNDVFADFWRRLSLEFKDNPRVMFGLVNEPHTMPTAQWRLAAQDAINAIRATGAVNTITVPGNAWTGMHSWTSNWYGTANSIEMLKITDPKNNFLFEVHQYLDSDFGGGYPTNECVSATIGSEKAKPFIAWLRANNRKAILGEIGTPNTSLCKSAYTDMMNYLKANSDVMVGWLWWNSIRDNFWGNPYKLDITPRSGVDDPRLAWITPFLTGPVPNPTPTATATATVTTPPPPPPPPSPTFPTAPISFTKETVFTVNSGTTNWVFVPSVYDSTHNTPISLFVWLHGCGGKSQYDVEMVSRVPNQTWISLAVGGREGACWSGVATDGPKVLAAIANIKTHFNVNPRKVYLGGYSSGGDIGYPLAFQNAKLFAGVLFENTGPNSTAMTASQTAAWKLNIAHLHHIGDTTYPITTIRTNLNTLKTRGFPVVLIEKPGTHWDNDNGTTGTTYDLRTFLLPYLNAGWVVPLDSSDAGVPDAGTTTDAGVTDAGTTPVDAGTDSGTTTPTYKFTVRIRKTYDWTSGYCAEIDLLNKNTVTLSWNSTTVNLYDGYIRDDNKDGVWDTWGGKFPARTGKMNVTPATWNKTVKAGGKATFGFCADRGPTKQFVTVVSVQ